MQRLNFGSEVINTSLHVPSTGLVIGHTHYGFPVVSNDNEIGVPVNEFWLSKTGKTDFANACKFLAFYTSRFPNALRCPTSSGAELKDAGTEKVLKNTEFSSPGWGDRARKLILSYKVPFTAEDLQMKMVGDPARHHNAWGAIFSVASRAKLIRRVGFDFASDPAAHGRPISVWEVCR